MSAQLRDLELYLQRLGYSRAPPPTVGTLRELHKRHTSAFVFETIDTLMRAPVPIDPESLQRKLLHEGRGGYCYELNLLFRALLQDLGFQVRGVSGRVVMGGPEDAMNARTHFALVVSIDGVDHLTDVGFGGMVPTAPLRLDVRDAQATPHERYRLDPRDTGYVLRALVGTEWRALYVFDLQPQAEIDHEVGNWYVSTHPQSPFRDQLFVARTGPGWRKTLSNGSFAIHRIDAPSQRRDLSDAEQVLAVLREEFDLRPPLETRLHETIGRCLAQRAST